MADGKNGHLAARADCPEEGAVWLAIIAQLCLPPRLQQAGRLDSESDPSISGLVSEKLKRATSSIAKLRRIPNIVLPEIGSRTCANANYASADGHK